jgi:glucans biosynthesis protein
MGVSVKKEKQPQGKWVLKNNNKPINLRKLPRCQATAKSTGKCCGNPAIKGKRVCYIHGGKSPGPPRGNKKALKHGFYTAEAIAERRYLRLLIKRTGAMIKKLKG